MTSYTLNVQPRVQYTIEYANQRGPQGATGAAGAATTDASLLVSGTLSDGRLSANVALENVANVFTAKQSFSGTDHVGLCLQSLTTAQYNTLTAANGDIFRDSTTDRIDARLSRGTVELIDSAGGQTIDSLKVTNLLDLRKSGTANLIQYSTNGFLRTDTSQLTLFNTGTGVNSLSFLRAGTTFTLASNISLGFATGTEAGGGTLDTHLSQASAGVLRIGTTSTNALGSLLLTNLTASGTGNFSGALTVTSYVYSDRITTPSFVLNSNGSNYGQIYRKDTTRWGLGYGASLGVTGSDSLLWGSTGVDVTGNLTASGTLRVGGGTVVANILSATATLDFPSISGNDTHTLTITVTGAVVGDSVFLGVPAGLDAGLIFCASVTAADTVTVRMHNSSGGSIDPASGTFRATVIRF